MIIDDSVEEKPYTDENEIVCWHYDHSKERQRQRHQLCDRTLSRRKMFLCPSGFI
ncbi:MAG: hypothetical protein WKF84_06135 [Pyrinomonadaceae bacterium]